MENNASYNANLFTLSKSMKTLSHDKIERDSMEKEKKTSFATLGRNSSGISITFSDEKDEFVNNWKEKLSNWKESSTSNTSDEKIPHSDVKPVSPPTPPKLNEVTRLKPEDFDLEDERAKGGRAARRVSRRAGVVRRKSETRAALRPTHRAQINPPKWRPNTILTVSINHFTLSI